MKTLIRTGIAALAIALVAPAVSFSQASCGAGGIPITYNGVPGCYYPNGQGSAPEISSSATYAGMALLIGGAFMVRGRKRRLN